MRSIRKYSFLLLLLYFANSTLVLATITCLGEAAETILNEYEVIGNKIYIQPDQLHITYGGIFIFIQGEQVFVQQINCDESGIYCLTAHLDKITDKCYNGHKIWCTRCWGCVVRECLFRCKCVEWHTR